MLVILSFALVLVAVVLLVLGLLTGSGLALIYTSMACSLAAGIVLYVAIRVSKPRVEAAGVGALSDVAPRRSDERSAAAAGTAPAREAEGTVAVLERPEEPDADEREPVGQVDEEPGAAELDDGEEFFPIADYDELSVSEIMPLLPELYPEELEVVEGRERATKSRVTILNRIAELRDEVAKRDDWGVPEEGWAEAGEPTAQAPAAAGGFPIDGYDDLTAAEIVGRLDGLDADALRDVREREEAGANRVTVLRAVGQALGEDVVGTTGAARKSATGKAAAKKSAKKSAAKKATAKKSAKKSAAKKATAKKSAKKSAAKKSTRGR